MAKRIVKVRVIKTDKLCNQCKYDVDHGICIYTRCDKCDLSFRTPNNLDLIHCSCLKIEIGQHCPYFVRHKEEVG